MPVCECQRVYHANPHRNLIECQCVSHGDKQTASMPAQCQCVSHGDKQAASMPV